MKKVEIRIVNEAIPFLVKGMSLRTNEEVIGFPYVHMIEEADGSVKYVNIILTPDGEGEDGFIQHPIAGNMYKYCYKDENGESVFEDRNLEDETVKAAMFVANSIEDPTEAMKKIIMTTFMVGAKWAADHGATSVNLTKIDTEQKL